MDHRSPSSNREHWILRILLLSFIPVGVVMSLALSWPSLLLLTLPGLIHLRIWNHIGNGIRAMRGRHYAWTASVLLYLFAYFGTTDFQPHGFGGLTGPVHVREFRSEYHLLVFYPCYLVERWIRNRSFTYSAYRFDCDFADGTYAHFNWLYGDGKYSFIWYDESWMVVFVFVWGSVAIGIFFRRRGPTSIGLAAAAGMSTMFLLVAVFGSWMALRTWSGW